MTRHDKPLAPGRLLGSALATALAVSLTLPEPVYADPPPHAPAHGWRKKHDPYYLGYTGKQWSRDYGILSGRCDREAVGAVLGGIIGGTVGSQVGDGSGRQVAILVGTAIGAILGAEVARNLGDPDRACIAHSLELLPVGKRANWDAPGGLRYQVIPENGSNSRYCRDFTLITEGAAQARSRGRGCRRPDGSWEISGV
jgi:surface antigen